MLKINNISKNYYSRRGTFTRALKNISLSLGDKGFVALHGKAGSGKSTLLNVIGGLETVDCGEIILNGVSSKAFKTDDYDSYRNSFVGFVFDGQNLFDELSVKANIALAAKLKGERPTDEHIISVLKTVGLSDVESLKPSELTVFQRRLVAIARAIIKNPEIIVADDPTRMLDGDDGAFVLQLLKRLSRDYLVVVATNERDFADINADRIIELGGGEIVRDVERTHGNSVLSFEGDTVTVPPNYKLTEQDRVAINDYIEATGISVRFSTPVGSDTKLKKSRLSVFNTFVMGCSGLGHKRLRLVFTVVLSVISLTFFGIALTFGSYNQTKSCTDSIVASDISYASVVKSVKTDNGVYSYWDNDADRLLPYDIERLSQDTGIDFKGVYSPDASSLTVLNTDNLFDTTHFRGFAEFCESDLEAYGYTMSMGQLPDGSKKEIAITDYIYDVLCRNGIDENIIGHRLQVGNDTYTVTGVVDTGFNFERYELLKSYPDIRDPSDELVCYILENELAELKKFSPICCMLVGEGFISDYITSTGGDLVACEYSFALAPLPSSRRSVRSLVDYCYQENGEIRYSLCNTVTYGIEALDEVYIAVSRVFVFVGVIFAIFAALMISAYIGTSIINKQRNILNLRALGARRSDIFKIFAAEALVISLINGTVSVLVAFVITQLINVFSESGGLVITALHFGALQCLAIFLISIVIAFVSGFVPILRVAGTHPSDIINNS